MKIALNISRVLVGVLFVISGLIKANDPLGFSYKLDEYFSVFGTDFMTPLSLTIAMLTCILEVGLGIALLMGYKPVAVSISLLGMIVFFTFLTFYSAYFNKVTDCGCFGDALKLTPWESFTKDIVLLVLILVIFFLRKQIQPLFSERMAGVVSWIGLGLSAWFTFHCYQHLPVKDFRPYAEGKSILDGISVPEGAKPDKYETKLYYEKAGEVKEFTLENYPWNDTTWKWKDTKNILVEKGYTPPIHDFKLTDSEGNDRTLEILTQENYHFFAVMYNVDKADKKVQANFNQLQKNCLEKKIGFIGVTGSSPEDAKKFAMEAEIEYEFFYCDGTALKTIIRSNPGLVLMKGGTVIRHWHHNDVPTFKEFEEAYLKP